MRTNVLLSIVVIFIILLIGYTMIGTDNHVREIKSKAPIDMEMNMNWKILRYESFNYGSWNNHGGGVWYHVSNIDNPSIQYRVFVTLWNGELQYHYGTPEVLERIEIKNIETKTDTIK